MCLCLIRPTSREFDIAAENVLTASKLATLKLEQMKEKPHKYFSQNYFDKFGTEKLNDRNSFVKKTSARIACITLFDETFRPSHYQSVVRMVSLDNA